MHILEFESGKAAWENLSALYENRRVANKFHIIEQLMNAKMGVTEKAQEHIEKLRRVVRKLGTLGVIIHSDQYKLSLLLSLPRSFESLVVTLEF